jgi:hypothetical protein
MKTHDDLYPREIVISVLTDSTINITTCTYQVLIESRYIDPRWGLDIDDFHVYIVSYCLFMNIGQCYLICLSLDVQKNRNNIF